MPALRDPQLYLEANYIPEPNSGCWIWLRSIDTSGYGVISASEGKGRGKSHCKRAHRMAYQFYNGEIPKGMCVLHRCDVRSCVNPDHLFLGTRTDNDADMRAKKRHSPTPGERGITCGEENGMAKLTEDDVAYIRRHREENWKVLARRYGVHHQTIWKIRQGLRWRKDQ